MSNRTHILHANRNWSLHYNSSVTYRKINAPLARGRTWRASTRDCICDNRGFCKLQRQIPQTYCDDHYTLDVLVLGQEPLVPLCIVRAKPIGLMKMIDQGEGDDKVIAVHYDDQEYAHYKSIDELPPHRLNQVRRFFEDYKALENKTVSVEGFLGAKDAIAAVQCSMQMYAENKKRLLKVEIFSK